MGPGLGTELPQRGALVWTLALGGLILAIPCAQLARRALGEDRMPTLALAWGMTAVVTLVLVVLPLMLARHIHGHRTYVSQDTLTWVQGDAVRAQMRVDQIETVSVHVAGLTGPDWLNERVTLTGTLADGTAGTLVVSGLFHESLEPLLTRLATEARARPEMLGDEAQRQAFEEALDRSR